MAEHVRRVIIAHTLAHASAALEVAAELQVPVSIQSAPDAIFYSGALYLHTMFTEARSAFPQADARFILDCADAGAETIAAVQMGHKHIRSGAAPELYAKLADIAAQCGAQMVSDPYEALDLAQARDIKQACREWLS